LATYKIDAQTISIQQGSFREHRQFAGTDWDAWVNNAYARKHQSYGWIGGWAFTCVEDASSVTWANSVAYHLYTHITDGAAVALEITNGTKHSLPVGQTVYVESVEVWYSAGMKTRYFSVKVRAV
jgi:hypothetical protein